MITLDNWKSIKENKKYAVSDQGRVASAASGWHITVMSPSDNGKGYKLIKITNPKRKNLYVHRLVAEAFLPNPNGYKEVNHINGNKSDNRAENLEWVSLQQNRDHAKKTGLIWQGEKSPNAKLTVSEVLEIRKALSDDPSINKTHLGKKYGVNGTTIRKIELRQRWASV